MQAIYKNSKSKPTSLTRNNLPKNNLQESYAQGIVNRNHKVKYVNEMNLSTFEKQKQRASWLRQHKLANSATHEKILQDVSLYINQQRTSYPK